MKKIILLLSVSFLAINIAFAQDDELPPPSSRPKTEELKKNNERPPDPGDFQGFKTKKKVDLSDFIIEPNFNFSIGQGYIDIGLSPYVGYKIFEPKKSKEQGNNYGLFAGGGITYRFKQVNFEATDPMGMVHYGRGSYHTYGGGVFLQYNIWKGFFARAKFELLHLSGDDLFQGYVYYNPSNGSLELPKLNKTVPALLVGAGYNLLRSKNFFMPVMISYNMLHSVVNKKYSPYPHGVVVQLGFVNLF